MKFLFFVFFCTSLFLYASPATMGPPGTINIDSMFNCPESYDNDKVSVNFDIKKIDGTETKVAFGTLKTSVPIDNSVTYEVELLRWENSGWKRVQNRTGIACDDWKTYFGDFAVKLGKAMQPNMTPFCPIPPGTYTLENFQSSIKDYKVPMVYYGRLKIIYKFLVDGVVLVCAGGEGTSQSLI